MSFFTTLQNQQAYLQNALNSAASQADLEIQSMDTEQSLQNEDNIANAALKSAGMSDLFLGAPVALRGLIEAPAIIEKAKENYEGIKESYAGMKERFGVLKGKAEEMWSMIKSAPDKLKALRESAVDPSMTPESLQAKVTELFGEKIGNGAVGNMIVKKLNQFKEAHDSIKAAALEHIGAGNDLSDVIKGHLKNVEDALNAGASPEKVSKMLNALKSGEAIDKMHETITGKSKRPMEVEMKEYSSNKPQPLLSEGALDRMKTLNEEERQLRSTTMGEMTPEMVESTGKKLTAIREEQVKLLQGSGVPVKELGNDEIRNMVNELTNNETSRTNNFTTSNDFTENEVKMKYPELNKGDFQPLNKAVPSSFEELAKGGKKAIVKKTPEMTALTEGTGESVLKRSVLQPFMEKVNTLKTATTERLKGLQSQVGDITQQLSGEIPATLRTNLEAQLQLVKNKIAGEVGNISTSNRIASLNEAEPKMVSAAKGEVDLVEPKIESARNKSFERIAPQKDSPFSNLAKEGLNSSETGLSSYYSKAKNYLTTLKESSPSKILGGTLGAGLEGLNTFGGVEAAKALTQGHISAMNVLQTSQLKSAPSAFEGAFNTIKEGVKATGEKGASLVENATNTLNEYATRAKSTISDTFDLLKSHVAESGAEDVAKGIAEKGLGSFLGEAVLGAVPIVGEVADAALGIGSIVEAIKDIGHKAAAPAPQPNIVQGVQQSHQAGIY